MWCGGYRYFHLIFCRSAPSLIICFANTVSNYKYNHKFIFSHSYLSERNLFHWRPEEKSGEGGGGCYVRQRIGIAFALKARRKIGCGRVCYVGIRVGIAKEKRLSGDTSVVSLFYITYYMSEKGETPLPKLHIHQLFCM